MMTTPKLEDRPEQHYMGIRTEAPMSALPDVIPQLIDEVFAWLEQHGIAPDGPPLMRYHVIDMAGMLDIELGVPVAQAHSGDERVRPNFLPAGRYGSLVYTGVMNGIAGNGALLDWGTAEGIVWDTYESPKGDGFGARYESFLMGPVDDPDPAKWDTEVAIRLADDQSR